ncbi:hypothetical protein DIPPA_33122 [Diplonema papillatum]|nr:hypothetical protein DIPPA_33122 [Diplonema papillatum]
MTDTRASFAEVSGGHGDDNAGHNAIDAFSNPQTSEPGWVVTIRKKPREKLGLQISQESLVIIAVETDSPASRAGVRHVIGRAITHVDEHPVQNLPQLLALTADKAVVSFYVVDAARIPARIPINNADNLSPSPHRHPVVQNGDSSSRTLGGAADPRISVLEERRHAAAAREDYREVNQLTNMIDQLRQRERFQADPSALATPMGQRVQSLEKRLADTEAALLATEFELDHYKKQSPARHDTSSPLSRVYSAAGARESCHASPAPSRASIRNSEWDPQLTQDRGLDLRIGPSFTSREYPYIGRGYQPTGFVQAHHMLPNQAPNTRPAPTSVSL